MGVKLTKKGDVITVWHLLLVRQNTAGDGGAVVATPAHEHDAAERWATRSAQDGVGGRRVFRVIAGV
jgi:hypothetical protein